jgi:hypothetical protein
MNKAPEAKTVAPKAAPAQNKGYLSAVPMTANPASKIGKACVIWNDELSRKPNATRSEIVAKIQESMGVTNERAKAYAGDIARRIKKAN